MEESLTAEQHQQVKDILGAALECPAAQRPALIEARCGTDALLRREVESLLEFESTSEILSGEPIVTIRPPPDESWSVGERVGPYRIVRRLGYGGMGAVYLAEQEEGVRRQVALKVIHRGMDTDEILRRFELERQILARLNHPYIARLLEAGATDDGRPYFAMDYVDGQPIDDYCESAGLCVRERLELFRKVCEAVQFSHQNLVVHRDLKPGNILITADGTPRLLDFGIAKLIAPVASTALALTTLAGQRPMTPAYASPELIRQEPAGTMSDVYSLGVMLFRLLTGRHPYKLGRRGAREIDRIICEQEPRRPSTITGVELAGMEVRKLKRELAGDLDAVVLKALRKEPGERYSSVESFSEDVRRFLEGQPVRARAGTFSYRAGKFVRRHRWPLATAAVFLLVVSGFVVALVRQVERTRAERNLANMSRDLFVEIVENTDPRQEEDVLTPESVVKRGVDLFGEPFVDEIEVHAAVFDSLGRVYNHRGFKKSARNLLEPALAIRRDVLGAEHPLVAVSLFNLAQLLGSTGETERAVDLSRQGLAILRRDALSASPVLAQAISSHATQLYHLGDLEGAEPLYRKALEMKIALYGDVHLSVATSWSLLGNLMRRQRRFEQARQCYERSLEIRRELLPPKHPDLARSFSQIGTFLFERGAHEEAEPYQRRAFEIRLEKYGGRHPDVAASQYRLALVLRRLEQYEEAEELFRRSMAARCATSAQDECASVKRSLAKLLVGRGETEEAEELASQAVAAFEQSGEISWKAADAQGVLAECLAVRGRFEDAEAQMLRVHSYLLETLGEDTVVTRDARRRLVALYEAWGRPEEAASWRFDSEFP